jgi:6-pyruvoyltetrahydropterin/6-carboxytetrahydropterin synthase
MSFEVDMQSGKPKPKALQLTRAIFLYLHPDDGHLVIGVCQNPNITATHITLWITIGDYFDHDSGFVVNVSEIDLAFKTALINKNYRPDGHYQIIQIAHKIITEAFDFFRLFSLKLDVHNQLTITQTFSEDGAMIEITKKYEICAAHWLNNDTWTKEKNVEVFGKCHNIGGHGHNYTLAITVSGEPHCDTGALDLTGVDETIITEIYDRFDHRNLNDLPEFAHLNPTVENMVQVCWQLIYGKFKHVALCKVGICETPKTYAEYCGN